MPSKSADVENEQHDVALTDTGASEERADRELARRVEARQRAVALGYGHARPGRHDRAAPGGGQHGRQGVCCEVAVTT